MRVLSVLPDTFFTGGMKVGLQFLEKEVEILADYSASDVEARVNLKDLVLEAVFASARTQRLVGRG